MVLPCRFSRPRLKPHPTNIILGIPELRTHDDVAYLQNTLFLDQSEEEAGESFKAEIDQALKDSWSVRVNWMAHIAAH